MTLKETILALVKDEIKIQTVSGKVISVNEQEMTCDIDLQNAPDLLDVRLRSIIDSEEKGILIIPEVDSYVLVGLINNRPESTFVSAYSEIDKIRFLIDDVQLSGDEFGGIVKVSELVSKLNALETSMNQLVVSFNAHTHTSPPAPVNPVVTTPPLVSSTVSLANSTTNELENNKVKHG